ncbi:MAG: amino acid ABC transporter permease [Rhodobacteraceae bacterium]|nr:amino acid ABC transporter permease [Paracoccaceae bacterium]MCY4197501.1 amino acid ABC transporter permease [Paracoccaceae bacterium]
MRSIKARLHWLDLVIVVLLFLFVGYVWQQIDGKLNYKWDWARVPNYLFRYDDTAEKWVANVLILGLVNTIRISIYASLLAILFGLILGVARTSRNLAVRMLARTYLELLRNIPPLVVIFIFFFFLSEQLISFFNIESWAYAIARSENAEVWTFLFGDMRQFPALISGIIVLALFESAFVGEILRAGIESVETGQREAARSLGMRWSDEMRFIVLPQALRKTLPPLANQFITLIKDSAIISLISVPDLTLRAVEMANSTRLLFETWIVAAGLYFILCFGLSLLFRSLETRIGRRTSK